MNQSRSPSPSKSATTWFLVVEGVRRQGRGGDVGEHAGAVVPVDAVRQHVLVGDQQIEVAVAVDVAEVVGVVVDQQRAGDATGRAVGEQAVAVVDEQLDGGEVVGDHQVEIAVAVDVTFVEHHAETHTERRQSRVACGPERRLRGEWGGEQGGQQGGQQGGAWCGESEQAGQLVHGARPGPPAGRAFQGGAARQGTCRSRVAAAGRCGPCWAATRSLRRRNEVSRELLSPASARPRRALRVPGLVRFPRLGGVGRVDFPRVNSR